MVHTQVSCEALTQVAVREREKKLAEYRLFECVFFLEVCMCDLILHSREGDFFTLFLMCVIVFKFPQIT